MTDRKGGRDVAADLHDILIGIPLKDENNHEPTVQARQHHSSGGSGGGGGGSGKATIVASGPRHHGNVHTTPLEIGMYVLLAAFCFAIVVFVVSCVVYASKFSPNNPQGMDALPALQGGAGLHGFGAAMGRVTQGVSGVGAAVVKRQHQPRDSRESTTNVHDWVWLGRATLERGSGSGHMVPATTNSSARSGPPLNINNNVMHITTNPNYADPSDVTEEMEMAIAECLSKPERVVEAEPVVTPRIDSSTYCKKDRDKDRARERDKERRAEKRHHHHRSHKSSQESNGDCWKLSPPPPPLPAHGSSPEKRVFKEDDFDYKPPVPPHRNIPHSNADEPVPVQPRRHHHHHHSHNRNNINNQCNKNNVKEDKKEDIDEEDLPDPTFVDFPDSASTPAQLQSTNAEVKRANIVGNPMFSSTEEEEDEEEEEDPGEEQRVREELLGLDDLNMDYDQIMEYFDNLKESNA